MEMKPITADLSVSAQITVADIQTIKDAGFRSIICNRPDGEGPDQPTFSDIENAALSAGLEPLYQPVIAGSISADDVAAFQNALTALPAPVFAYCRTGNRCTMLWNLIGKARID